MPIKHHIKKTAPLKRQVTSGFQQSKTAILKVAGLTASRAINSVCNGLALILLARWLGPSSFGEVSIAVSIIGTISGVLALGLPVFALRSAVLKQTEATGFALMLNLATSAIAAIAGFIVAIFWTTVTPIIIALLAASAAIEKNAEVRIGLGAEFGKAKLVTGVLTVRGVLALVLVVIGRALGFSALYAYTIGRFIVFGASALALAYWVRGWPMVLRKPNDGSLEVLSGLATQSGISALRALDVTLVGAVAGAIGAGLYSGVQKFVTPVMFLMNSLRVVALGPIARGDAKRAVKTANGTVAVVAIATILLGIVAIWARPLVVLILGESFAGAANAFRWMLTSMPAFGACYLLVTILQDKGFASWTAWSTAINVAMTLAGIAFGGLLGGATGAMAAWAITAWIWFTSLYLKIRTLNNLDARIARKATTES